MSDCLTRILYVGILTVVWGCGALVGLWLGANQKDTAIPACPHPITFECTANHTGLYCKPLVYNKPVTDEGR